MIGGFKDRRLKRFFEHGQTRRLESTLVDKIQSILALLDAAEAIEAMNVHTLHLHPLTGDLQGYWSVTVRANWRIIFRFEDGKAFDVELIDYH